MSGAVLTYRPQLIQRGAQGAHKLIIVVVAAVALVTCSGNSDALTARFEVTQIPGEGAPGATFKGIGDFAAGEMTYTLFFGHRRGGAPAVGQRGRLHQGCR